jgi:hypothetical protein
MSNLDTLPTSEIFDLVADSCYNAIRLFLKLDGLETQIISKNAISVGEDELAELGGNSRRG